MIRVYNTQHKEYNQVYNNFKWGIIYKSMESVCCTPETNNIANQLDFSNTTP